MHPLLLHIHSRPVSVVKFNRDGDLLMTCGLDGFVNLIKVPTGERIGTFDGHGKQAVRGADFTHDSKMVVTAGADGNVVFYHTHNGQKIKELVHGGVLVFCELNQHPTRQNKLLTCQNRLGANAPNAVKVWEFDFSDLDEPKIWEELSIDNALPMKATQAKWGPLDKTIITIHEEGTFVVWDAKTGAKIKLVDGHLAPIKSLQFNVDRTLMVTASRDKTIKMWETESWSKVKTFTGDRSFNDAAISPLYKDAKHPKFHLIAGGGVDAREVTQTTEGGFESVLFNLVTEEELGKIKGHFGPMNCLSISPTGRTYCTGGEEGLVRIIHFDQDYLTKDV